MAGTRRRWMRPSSRVPGFAAGPRGTASLVNAQLEPTAAPRSGGTSAPGDDDSGHSRDWGLAALCLLLAVVAYWGLLGFQPARGSGAGRAHWFFEPSETSPLLVVALALWLLLRRWGRLSRLPLAAGRPVVSALLLGAGLASLAWAIRSRAPDLQAFSLILMALGTAHLLAGARALRAALLPAVFLAFCVPLPAPLLNHAVWRLQIWTAEFAGALLTLLGIPALVSGDQILLADSAFAVIETCSGLRSIETLIMLALLMADLFRRRGLHAALLLAAAPPIAFGINGLRAAALVVNPHAHIAGVHDVQGVAMLLAGVSMLYLWDGALARLLIDGEQPDTSGTVRAPGLTRAEVLAIQNDLTELGYNPGPVDGIVGARTTEAIKAYQKDAGLEPDGRITQILVFNLAAAPRPEIPTAPETTETAKTPETPQPAQDPEPEIELAWPKKNLENGTLVVRIDALEYGTYAISVLDDIDLDEEMKFFLGIPREGFGFSMNPPHKLHEPDFEESAIEVDRPFQRISIEMRYIAKGGRNPH